jgi:HemY protein
LPWPPALFAGNNQSSVTWFWSPYRVDMSLNLALVLLFLAFVLLYAALRALAVLLQMPHQASPLAHAAKRARHEPEPAEALSHLQAGRFLRARKSAWPPCPPSTLREAKAGLPYGERLSATAHLIAADASTPCRMPPCATSTGNRL